MIATENTPVKTEQIVDGLLKLAAFARERCGDDVGLIAHEALVRAAVECKQHGVESAADFLGLEGLVES